MTPALQSARVILISVAASYVLSAVILLVVRLRGTTVPAWVIGGWLVTGVAGVALGYLLAPGRAGVWVAAGVVLLPWMIYSTYGDAMQRSYVMTTVDILGVLAIVYALYLSSHAAFAAA